MKTIFDRTGQLNLELFEPRLLRQTNNLDEVLAVAIRTESAHVESTHFLMALIKIPNGVTQEFCRRLGIPLSGLETGLADCVIRETGGAIPRDLTLQVLHESAREMITALDGYLESEDALRIDEGQLLMATLEHLTPSVVDNFKTVMQLAPQDLIAILQGISFRDHVPPSPFDDHSVRLEAFSPGGRRVLDLMKAEAEALGYPQIDPRHLLLALLEYEGGATQVALYQQNVSPKKVQEKVMVNLRGRARGTRSQLDLSLESVNSSVVRILKQAAKETEANRSDQIAEAHILRSFLGYDTFALRQLADAGVDLLLAKDAAQRFRPEDEAAPTGASEMKSWETIKANLENALVGQQDVVDMCLPFIRRMRFGLQHAGKPAGVLFFCGPSGSGKTEMAKAIARAVFGGEENLIMLEMGQFQTKESMNIFVGAPPGYIGYGEGKLTNGLRDKPRSVVLFDEVEKAHPQVFDALLRFIDEGQIDDPAGPIRDGSECVIVMTSNIQTGGLEKLIQDGDYRKNKWEIRRKLREALLNLPVESQADSPARETFRFRPEFLNRIDEIVLFRALNRDDLTEIARRYLDEYKVRLRDEKQINLTFGSEQKEAAAVRLIGHFCAGLDEGARATLRVIQTSVLDPVIDFFYEHVYDRGYPLPVSLVIQLIKDEATQEPRGIVGFLEE